LTVAILIRYEEWVQLSELKTAPHEYLRAEDFWAATVATDFLRKLKELPTGVDTAAVARQKWWMTEQQCFDTNRRLDPFLDCDLTLGPECDEGGRLSEFLRNVRKEILDVIGTSPPNLSLEGTFGPGATLSNASREATVAHKMTSCPTLTRNAWPWLFPWTGTAWAQASADLRHEPVFVEGNHYFTVPKDATTDRSCAKEAAINAYFQRAVGLELARLLKRTGIDLSAGQDVHKQVACAASLSGEFCTIDLSNASDTVATTLVKLLLPPKWFELLSSLRSTKTRIDGKWVLLEKFSSMGNGFTFELETLIFLCIARAMSRKEALSYMTVEVPLELPILSGGGLSGHVPMKRKNFERRVPRILVFGDDIIVPQTIVGEVLSALRWCGFTPNKRKTFTDGVFRESCGGDYFSGVAVRPHNLESIPCEPQEWISLANAIRRLVGFGPQHDDRWRRLRPAWFCCLGFIPRHIRVLRGPTLLGDLVIHDRPITWENRDNLRERNSIRYIKCYRPARFDTWRWNAFPDVSTYAAALYLAGKEQSGSLNFSRAREGFPPRDNVLGYKVGWVPFS
jgi:hypothetical protein